MLFIPYYMGTMLLPREAKIQLFLGHMGLYYLHSIFTGGLQCAADSTGMMANEAF